MNDSELTGIDGTTDVVVYSLMCAALAEMKDFQAEVGKSDRGRYISISVTDLEKVVAFWSTYVLDNKVNGRYSAQ